MDLSCRHLSPTHRRAFIGRYVTLAGVLILVAIGVLLLDAPSLGLICPLLLGFFLVLLWIIKRLVGMVRSARTVEAHQLAEVHYRHGRYEQAVEVWEPLLQQTRDTHPVLHAIYLVSLAAAWLRLSHLDAARTLLERTLASGWLQTRGLRHLRAASLLKVGLIHALTGDLAQAHACRTEAEQDPLFRPEGALLLDAVLQVRGGTGPYEPTPEALRAAEAELSTLGARALELLARFSRSRDEAYRAPADEAPIDRLDDLAYLAVGWPELRAYLERHA